MTAKEKVLKVWPDARVFQLSPGIWVSAHGDDPDNPGYAILGKDCDSEEAAWQNAAESLPAQPEPKRCSCGAWICQSCGSCSSDCGCAKPKIPCDCWFKEKQVCDICQGVGGANAQPVESLPVEAKDAPFYLCFQHGKNPCPICHADKVVEPKFTPSTPAGELDFVKELRSYAVGDWRKTFGITRSEARWILDNLKPQPESSPIPEQTFEEWWDKHAHGRIRDVLEPHLRLTILGIAEAAWNAAKGVK